MMKDQSTTAIVGTGLGLLIGYADINRDWHRRTRNAKHAADDAQMTANEALLQVRSLAQSGDLARLGSDQVSDLMTGLAYPGQQPAPQPSNFAGVQTTIARPVLTEALASEFFPWPGKTNLYGPDGKLLQPNNALVGQNMALGLALNFAEIRALLLGFTQKNDPSVAHALQYFRYARGLSDAIAELPESLTQAEWKAFWQRQISASVPGSSGLLFALLSEVKTDGVIVTNTTTETVALELEIPANAITKAGDALNVDAAFTATGVNSTNTDRVRAYLDSTSGLLLWDTGAVNPSAGDSAIIRGQAKAQSVGPTTGKLALGGISQLSGTAKGPANPTVTFDNTIAHKIVFTITQSAASTSNTMLARYGQVVLQSAPPAPVND